MKVVWTERAWERLTEAAVRLVDKLIARGDALGRYPDRGRKLPEIPGSGLRELVVDSYRIVYRRMLNTIEVLAVFEGHRLLRRDELPEDV
jgi:plasmid stabilization system protein ParE